MALDPTIILAGQSPDIVNALSRANDAAQNRLNYDRQNAMNAMLKENGAGIMAGDQNALNALAGYDPQAALGIQAQRQDMAFSAEKMQMARDEGKRMAEEAMKANADKLSADQLAAEQQKIESALAGAASFYQKGDRAGYDAWLGQLGLDPQEYSFDQFPAHAAMFDGVLEAMKTFAPPPAPEPMSPEGKFAADKAAGLLPADAMPQKTGDTINVGGGSDKQLFDTIAAGSERAASAAVGLNSLAEAQKAIDGGVITGFAADQRLYLSKLGGYLGITDPAAVENTETFRAAIAPQVSAMIKATVGSANISNADREFAEKAAAGSITLDEASIKRMIKIMDKMGREAIAINNKKVDAVYPEGQGYDRERALFLVPVPPPMTETVAKTGNTTANGVTWSVE